MDADEPHAWSVELAERAVDGSAGADLDGPTPCRGWSHRGLLGHMTASNRGVAAAAAEEGDAAAAKWASGPLAADPAADFRASCAEVVGRFAAPGGDVRIGPYGFAAPRDPARSMYTLDSAVHAWDVAAACGLPLAVDDAPSRALLASAEAMPLDLAPRRGNARLWAGHRHAGRLRVRPCPRPVGKGPPVAGVAGRAEVPPQRRPGGRLPGRSGGGS